MRGSVEVHNFLVEHDVPHEVIPVPGRVRSAERLAALLDLSPRDVGKVIIYEGAGQDEPVVAVVPAGQAVDIERFRRAAGRADLRRATPDRAAELTGFLPESMPPVGLPGDFAMVLDPTLARDRVLYFPAGETRAVLKIRGKDLARAAGATVAKIVQRTGR